MAALIVMLMADLHFTWDRAWELTWPDVLLIDQGNRYRSRATERAPRADKRSHAEFMKFIGG
ncbi:hypothetical protein A2cp1_1311 [Anaeromyxobacter dehalogenans 2CP-1]|uniref:Uncharacterized protein n=1 Tax=Anaeromyxobacter dehalogenans (strain ATCC BAA-258 / DSM 21875 / 2CP-1) TaxID=455488 RepID=B8JGI4_ANAD2|nr:hypothetical protein A2cp1_1311 [Anaeromyxobacter dehalogenans 2CP-1]